VGARVVPVDARAGRIDDADAAEARLDGFGEGDFDPRGRRVNGAALRWIGVTQMRVRKHQRGQQDRHENSRDKQGSGSHRSRA
jgi:hypothetical protein